jgi:hypothetical protein
MAQKTMPGKLMILVALMAVGVIADLVSGAIVPAAISGALAVGVLVGNDGVRKFLIGLSAVQVLWAGVLLLGATAVSSGALVITCAFAIALPLLYIWVLSQNDVRDWMFRKNFHIDD